MKRRAFSLVEVILAMVIVAIMGGALLDTFVTFFASYAQTEDYALARMEIENAFRFLAPRIPNAGLGMPNNAAGRGSFAAAFAVDKTDPAPDEASVMAFMGDVKRMNTAWGGPVTVARGDICADQAFAAVLSGDSYVGPELFYAWARPTGVMLSPDICDDSSGALVSMDVPLASSVGSVGYEAVSQDRRFWSDKDTILRLRPTTGNAGVNVLKTLFSANQPAWTSGWLLFPSFGAPCLITGWGSDTFSVRVAPHAFSSHFSLAQRVLAGGVLYGLEEIYRVRVARVRVLNGNLVQEFYGGTAAAPTQTELLARNIAAVCFQFDPAARALRMSVAARGTETGGMVRGGVPNSWPKDVAPVAAYFTSADLERRILVESMTWRIRN